jgi:[acyl-carrier-protein] S-malonyltransferase
MSLAFLFPGQGSHREGMAADLQAARPDLFERYFGTADSRSGLPLGRLCLEGSLEELTPTDIAQPAIFTLSVALTELAREAGVEPDLVAGHSLGEYSAVVASGAIDWETGLDLVCLRGRLMAAIQEERPGAMGAISGLPAAKVELLCASAVGLGTVVLANHNSEHQCVVSGEEAAVEKVIELAQSAGAEQALRLRVGAAFHSPLMEPVQAPMAEALERAHWREPRCPVATNAGGRLVTTAVEVREALVAQVTSRVRWFECMGSLIEAGADSFLELGPGRVLVGQARLIDHDLDVSGADGPKKLDNFLATHPGLVRR